jgi:hypothetical protein
MKLTSPSSEIRAKTYGTAMYTVQQNSTYRENGVRQAVVEGRGSLTPERQHTILVAWSPCCRIAARPVRPAAQ